MPASPWLFFCPDGPDGLIEGLGSCVDGVERLC